MARAFAFIIRPFGTKAGVDFERVERDLVDPALAALEVAGRTTAEIVQQGNIRSDMFDRLLTADLVIADVSIHNANVFYELGIRHAFREKRTFLIRARIDEVPFDLKTDRYFSYDPTDPGASCVDLTRALRTTLDSATADSPVFMLLPHLRARDASSLVLLPLSFREEVERAEKERDLGRLAFLADEIAGLSWEKEGLRAIGRAQSSLRAWEGARVSFGRVCEFDPRDFEANRVLGTIHQRLGDLTRSDQAVRRVLDESGSTPVELAEAHALLGSNDKVRWREDWRDVDGDERGERALRSPYLQRAIEHYRGGFLHDRNHYYSGLNQLALAGIRLELARRQPAVWNGQFESDEDAARELARLDRERFDLVGAVRGALESARHRGSDPRWTAITGAHLALLTSERPDWVGSQYLTVFRGATAQEWESEIRQLDLYAALDLYRANVAAARKILADEAPDLRAEAPVSTLLFTGHRIDAPGRESPRFPASAEGLARRMIEEGVDALTPDGGTRIIGIAGAASGGDILFHEVCRARGIETRVYLAAPRDAYVAASVADAGESWIARFDALCRQPPPLVLTGELEPPPWNPDASTWERSNLWMLNAAWSYGAARAAVIALWNGEGGDGPGGTAHMVAAVTARGGRVVHLDAKRLIEPREAAPRPASAVVVQRGPRRAFVSRAEADADLVRQGLREFLDEHEFEPTDRDSRDPGRAEPTLLRDAVRAADRVLVVVTHRSACADSVKDEVQLAFDLGKAVASIRFGDADPNAIHPRLAAQPSFDIGDEEGRRRLEDWLAETQDRETA